MYGDGCICEGCDKLDEDGGVIDKLLILSADSAEFFDSGCENADDAGLDALETAAAATAAI